MKIFDWNLFLILIIIIIIRVVLLPVTSNNNKQKVVSVEITTSWQMTFWGTVALYLPHFSSMLSQIVDLFLVISVYFSNSSHITDTSDYMKKEEEDDSNNSCPRFHQKNRTSKVSYQATEQETSWLPKKEILDTEIQSVNWKDWKKKKKN